MPTPRPDVGSESGDRVVFFTDLHFWEIVWNPFRMLNKRFLGNANVLLRRARRFPMGNARLHAEHALGATGARQVILGGDLTCTATDREFGMAREFVEFLTRLGARVSLVPGNHDVYTVESVRLGRVERYLGKWLPPQGLPSPLSLPGGTQLLFVPTAVPTPLSSQGLVTDSELHAVGEVLRAMPNDRPILVVGHYPLLRRTDRYVLTEGRALRGDQALRQILAASGHEILYLSGHVHRFSDTVDPEYPRLRHVTGPTLFGRYGRGSAMSHGGFVELHATPAGFEVVLHERRSVWERSVSHP